MKRKQCRDQKKRKQKCIQEKQVNNSLEHRMLTDEVTGSYRSPSQVRHGSWRTVCHRARGEHSLSQVRHGGEWDERQGGREQQKSLPSATWRRMRRTARRSNGNVGREQRSPSQERHRCGSFRWSCKKNKHDNENGKIFEVNDEVSKEDVEIRMIIEERWNTSKGEKQRLKDLSKQIRTCIRDKKRQKRKKRFKEHSKTSQESRTCPASNL